MLLVSEEDVRAALTMEAAIAAVRDASRVYAEGSIQVPERIGMDVRGPTQSAIFLAANCLSVPFYGIKHACSFPANKALGLPTVLADIHLYSAETGELLALISARHLTAVKTGAAAAVATDALARSGAVVLAIIGTGVQAQTQIEALQLVRPLQEVKVFDTNAPRAAEFARLVERLRNRPYRVTLAASADECVAGADIVSTATTSTTPVFKGDSLQEGAHLNAIGSFTPAMQEIDAVAVRRAGKIVTDCAEETWQVAGDLLAPLAAGEIKRSCLHGELGAIVAGRLPGRENDREITLYESVGFAALDIAVAVAVYRQAQAEGLGTSFDWSGRAS